MDRNKLNKVMISRESEIAATPLLRSDDLYLWNGAKCIEDLAIYAGDRIGLLGAAGSGKTTLLRVLAGLQQPAGGRLLWENTDVTRFPQRWWSKWRKEVTLIWENPYVLGNQINVRTLINRGISRASQSEDEICRILSLSPAIMDFPIRSLSGLQRVLVALTYAYRRNPKLLLVDDVFRYLAPETWENVLGAVARITDEKCAVVISSRFPSALRSMETIYTITEGQIAGPKIEYAQDKTYLVRTLS